MTNYASPPMSRPVEAEAFVLAGGRSTRMGRDKAQLCWAGRTLLQIALDKLRTLPLVAEPRIAGARAELSSHAAVLLDIHPDCGPLSGIESALAASSHPLNLFLPVDLPLIPAAFLRWMLLRAQITGALVTIPRLNGQPQPLCAVYHRDLLPAVTASLDNHQYKVMRAVMPSAAAVDAAPNFARGPALRTDMLEDLFDVESIASVNQNPGSFSSLPPYRWFHNCNTPEDMFEML